MNHNRKPYQKPSMAVTYFDRRDVIATSGDLPSVAMRFGLETQIDRIDKSKSNSDWVKAPNEAE